MESIGICAAVICVERHMLRVLHVFAVRKATVTEAAKRREQEKGRQEKIAETGRIALQKHHGRSESRAPKRCVRVLNLCVLLPLACACLKFC